MKALGYLINEALVINDQTYLFVYKGHDGRYRSCWTIFKKKILVFRDEAPYFSKALDFSLPKLLLNSALVGLMFRLQADKK